MKLNTDKCHLMILSYKHGQIWAQVGKIWMLNVWELLFVKN